MKQRVMVAVVGLPLLLVVVLALPAVATALLVSAIAAVGAFELLRAVGKNTHRAQKLTIVSAALLPLVRYAFGTPAMLCFAAAFIYAVFALSVMEYGRDPIPFADVTACIVAGVIFPLFLGCITLLRADEDYGRLFVLTPFFAAFAGDSLAMFGGMLFGRHKLAPHVSPKKTIEGSVAGLLGSAVGMVLWGMIAAKCSTYRVDYLALIAYGLLGGAVGQLGDLSLSVIKRETGIKDYGDLLPGHGGVYDRFDSVTFIAPVFYLLFSMRYMSVGAWV